MDNKSNEEFERYTKKPKLVDLIQFLKKCCRLLENIKNKTTYTGYVNKKEHRFKGIILRNNKTKRKQNLVSFMTTVILYMHAKLLATYP